MKLEEIKGKIKEGDMVKVVLTGSVNHIPEGCSWIDIKTEDGSYARTFFKSENIDIETIVEEPKIEDQFKVTRQLRNEDGLLIGNQLRVSRIEAILKDFSLRLDDYMERIDLLEDEVYELQKKLK